MSKSKSHHDDHHSDNYNSCHDYDDCDMAQVGDCFVMEAEDFDQYGFYTTCSNSASGGEIVKLCSSQGTLTQTFTGETAIYDLSIFAQDECDGESTIAVYVDGVLLTTIVLDDNNDGGGSDNGSFTEFSLGTIEVPAGAEITIAAYRDGGEYVRIDNLCLTKVADVTPDGECEVTVIAAEDFNNLCDLDDAALVRSDDHWQAYNGAAYADGYNDGVLKFETVAVTGETKITLDVMTYDVSPFETNDEFTVKAAIDGEWVVLDVFTRDGDQFVGSNTGQTYGESMSTLTYTVGDANTSEIQFKIDADFSYCDETVLVDNVEFSSTADCEEPEDDCADAVEVCEDFDNVRDLDDAALVRSDDQWEAYNGAAYADGYNDGVLKFETVAVTGETTITLDVMTYDVSPFESNDEFTVKAAIDGEWVVLDVFTRDGNEFVGSNTGQTYGESMSTLTYTVGDANTSEIQFKIDADFSYCDETVLVDNVCFTSAAECQDCEDTKETFDAANAGDVASTQFDGFTVTAQRSGDSASSENDAMIFDSASPTGGDNDLGFSGKGKIVIISEDNDSNDPDDNARGGTITFTFDNPSSVTNLELLDIEEDGGTIDLFDINGTLIKSVAIPGLYDNSAQTIDIDAEGVVTMNVNLVGSGAINDLCFEPGEVVDTNTASLAGRYFCDENDNDIDDAEPAIVGATVELLDATGTVIDSTTTDANGDYEFTDLAAGTYSVRFAADVDGKTFVSQDDPNGNGDDTTDSDVNPTTGETGPITLAIGERSEDNDAGVEDPGTASLAGRYFCDENDNDIDDAEPAIVGATVELLDATGTVIDSTTTDANGDYEFTDLAAGTYSVRFAADVDGKTFVSQDDPNGNGDDTTDSDVNPTTGETGPITLAIGERSEDNDAGVEDPGTAELGNFVFFDENKNGVFDGVDTAVENVEVKLLDSNGVQVGSSQFTDQNGNYLFTGLNAGMYQVMFTAPAALAFSPEGAAADDAVNNDSDADILTGLTDLIELSIGESELNIDAGLVEFGPPSGNDPAPEDDAAMTCADTAVVVDVLANDPNPELYSVTALDGITIMDGETISLSGSATITDRDGVQTVETFSGLTATLDSSGITFDASAAFGDLEIGESAEMTFSYVISDVDGATGTADIDLKLCGALNTLESIGAYLDGAVIVGTLESRSFDEFDNPYDLIVTSSSLPDDIPLGEYGVAFCIDAWTDISLAVETTFVASVATEENAAAAGVQNIDMIDEINWILNQDFGSMDNGDGNGLTFTDLEIQEAIWTLLNDTDGVLIGNYADLPDNENGIRDGNEKGTMENAYDIVEFALAAPNTDEFIPQNGDIVGIILDPSAPSQQVQPFIIGVAYEDLAQDCLCL